MAGEESRQNQRMLEKKTPEGEKMFTAGCGKAKHIFDICFGLGYNGRRKGGIIKKFLVVGVLLAAASFAAGSDLGFCLSAGLGTEQHFTFNPIILTVNAELDFKIGYGMVSLEAVGLTNTKFEDFILIPAVCVNVTTGSLFFCGFGIAKEFVLGGTYSSDFMLKLNIGFRAGGIRIGTYVLSSLNPSHGFFCGVQIGFEL